MIEKSITIINKLGLHARAASKFVATASKFESEVRLAREGQTVNGKSIMGVLMLAAPQGTDLLLSVCGEDEERATQNLVALVEDRFGEDS